MTGALEQAGVRPSDLHAVAYTLGPGLPMCLRVGVLKALNVACVDPLRPKRWF